MRWQLILVVLLVLIPSVAAENITFSFDQSDYYFPLGQDAVVEMSTNNTYGEAVSGMLSYTIAQTIQQGNFQYSSTSMKSTTFNVDDGEAKVPFGFGTSDTPAILDVSFQFSYTKDTPQEVSVSGIRIHFIQNGTQQQGQQSQVSSSSQAAQQQSTPQQSPQQPSTSQKLQNSQMVQDSSALKQEMQQQLEEQQSMRDEFQKQLAQDPAFQQAHQELLSQGYNLTGGEIQPTANDTGDFSLDYQNPNGDQASLEGRMEDGEVKDLQETSNMNEQEALDSLRSDERFQQYDQQLQDQGFQPSGTDISQRGDELDVQVQYQNAKNDTALIKAGIYNQTVESVELEKETNRSWWWLIPLAFAGLAAVLLLARKKGEDAPKAEEVPFDHRKAALVMLGDAEACFGKKEFKDAYGKAAQAIRLYLGYENGLEKELTNDEIVSFLRGRKLPYKEVKKCFDLCSLVEFAKYEANRRDFGEIIGIARGIVG